MLVELGDLWRVTPDTARRSGRVRYERMYLGNLDHEVFIFSLLSDK